MNPTILDSWEKVQELEKKQASGPPDGGLLHIFRGQGDSRWGLKPSLTRLLSTMGLSNPNNKKHVAKAVKAEEESIKTFQIAHPMPADLREWIFWWAVAQHYGGMTRVLDWSGRPGVAVYFAVSQQPDKDGAVFELTRKALLQDMNNPTDVLHDVYNSDHTDRGWKRFQRIFRLGDPLAMHVCTTQGTPVRMSVQQGYFTSCTNVLEDHERVIQSTHPWAIRKYIVPRESKPRLLREACLRGLSGPALFSDSSEKAGYAQRDEIIQQYR
jgi:hypothetical protein